MLRPLFVLLLLLGAGCGRRKSASLNRRETIVSLSITKRQFPGAPSLALGSETLTQWISSMEEGSGFPLALGASKKGFEKPYHLEVEYTIRPISTIRPIRREGEMHNRAFEVSVQMMLQPLYTTSLEESLHATESVWRSFSKNSSKQLDRIFVGALKEAVEKAATAVWFRAGLIKAPPAELLTYLSSQKRAVRMATVEIVGRRRLTQAVPMLLKMLKSETREQYKMRIAGVLGLLGDERAVEPLSEFALSLTDEHTVAVLSIIAGIGGEKAKTFLQWMAAGHQSKAVRKGAQLQLHRLDARY